MVPTKNKTAAVRRARAFKRQKGKCYYCLGPMILEKGPTLHGARPNPKMCTLEHLDDKLNPDRGSYGFLGFVRTVAACWQCNNARNKIREQSLPVEELHRRSGRAPKTAEQPST